PDGSMHTIAGNGTLGFSGDGGPATQAELNAPNGVAVGPDGTVYIADSANQRVRAVAPDGTIRTVAGTGINGIAGDGGPATQAQLSFPQDVAVAADGTLYISLPYRHLIRAVAPDGTIRTATGTGGLGSLGDGGPATQ